MTLRAGIYLPGQVLTCSQGHEELAGGWSKDAPPNGLAGKVPSLGPAEDRLAANGCRGDASRGFDWPCHCPQVRSLQQGGLAAFTADMHC